MKWLFKLITLMLFFGVVLVGVGLLMGIDREGLQGYITDNESFGEQIEYTTEQEINEIRFNLDTRDVVFYLTDESNIRILYYAKESDTWTVSENSGIFSVEQNEKPRAWFFFRIPARTYRQVEVFVPRDLNLDLDIHTKTGLVKAEFTEVQTYGSVSLKSNTGSVTVSKINATRFNAQTNTGSVTIDHIHAEEAITLTSSTGSIVASVMSGQQLTMKTNTGSARLEDADIVNQTKITVSTGSITVIESISASYELTSGTGDIKFTVVSGVSYRYDLSVSTGIIRIYGNAQGKSHQTTDGDVEIIAKTSTGDIRILS